MLENKGKIVRAVGPVVDIVFDDEHLPSLNNAILIDNNGVSLTVEVAQHIGDDVVRCIAMGSTDGLVRGAEAIDTGKPIAVPVGNETLGRMFNVLGQPIDEKEELPDTVSKMPIHRSAPTYSDQRTETEILETGIKVVHISRVVRLDCLVELELVKQY